VNLEKKRLIMQRESWVVRRIELVLLLGITHSRMSEKGRRERKREERAYLRIV